MSHSDRAFVGAIPKLYDGLLVPLIFAPYAEQLARMAAARQPARVLEIAAGTGVLTRALANALPPDAVIVATDLNRDMLEEAAAVGASRAVEWRPADAMHLPFDDAAFDLVVCQFGVMFFPDKPRAHAEVRRVLRRGGAFLFNVWDHVVENEFADAVTRGVARVFPEDPPRFLPRVAHGYHDRDRIVNDLATGGFSAPPQVAIVAERSRAETARIPAVAYCQGTPLRNEIEARDPARLTEATEAATEAVAEAFGRGPVDGKIQALVVAVAG